MSETLSASFNAFLAIPDTDIPDLDEPFDIDIKELDIEEFQSKDGTISMTPQHSPDSSDDEEEASLARKTLRANADSQG